MQAKLLRSALWVLTLVCVAGLLTASRSTAEEPKDDPAVARTRKTVRMLDDIYKTAIVLITKHYVDEDSDLAAGEAFKALFDGVKQKGWHEVRLLDATGEPLEEKNSPQDAFEKDAVKQLLAGEGWHEEVVERDGKRYLRAATPIPVVMQKCTMCHDNYNGVKEGQPIGALSYTIVIE
jgi:hypothetical protein